MKASKAKTLISDSLLHVLRLLHLGVGLHLLTRHSAELFLNWRGKTGLPVLLQLLVLQAFRSSVQSDTKYLYQEYAMKVNF